MTLPVLFRLRSSESFVVTTCGIAIFTDLFLYGIIVPVLPYALSDRFSVTPSETQSKLSTLLAVYAAALVLTCPVTGWVADRTKNRRVPFLAGLGALIGATLLFTLARTYALLVVARVLQGVSAAVVWTVGLALLVDTVGKDRIGVAMGTVTIFMGVALALAPLLGGILYQTGGYYAPFYLSFGLLVLDVVLRLMIIEKKTALALVNAGSAMSQEYTEAPRRSKYTIPPIIRLLKVPRLLAGCWIGFCASFVLTAFDAVLPLYVEDLWGFSPLGAGVLFIALVVPSFVVSPVGGWFIDTRGTKGITLLGVVLEIPFLVLLRLPNATSPRVGQVVLMCALLALNGAAVALIMPASLIEVALIVDLEEKRRPGSFGKQGAYAQAYALFNVAYSLGALAGPLVAGKIREVDGWETMCWALSLFLVASVPIVFFIVGGPVREAYWFRRIPRADAEPDHDSSTAHELSKNTSQKTSQIASSAAG